MSITINRFLSYKKVKLQKRNAAQIGENMKK